MIKVVWHYATIASIEIFHNKQEIGQHKFRLIRHNEKSCFKTTLCENETIKYYLIIRLTKITAAQNEVSLSYHRVRGLYFLAVVFTATIVID